MPIDFEVHSFMHSMVPMVLVWHHRNTIKTCIKYIYSKHSYMCMVHALCKVLPCYVLYKGAFSIFLLSWCMINIKWPLLKSKSSLETFMMWRKALYIVNYVTLLNLLWGVDKYCLSVFDITIMFIVTSILVSRYMPTLSQELKMSYVIYGNRTKYSQMKTLCMKWGAFNFIIVYQLCFIIVCNRTKCVTLMYLPL